MSETFDREDESAGKQSGLFGSDPGDVISARMDELEEKWKGHYQPYNTDYLSMMDALSELSAVLNEYYAPTHYDEQNGIVREPPVLIGEEQKAQLLQLYADAMRRCEEYVPPVGEKQAAFRADLHGLVQQLAEGMHTVARIDPAAGVTLPQAMHRAHGMDIRLTEQQAKAMGNAMSARIPMTVTGQDGRPINGFFTKNTVYSPGSVLFEQLEQYKDSDPVACQMIRTAYQNFKLYDDDPADTEAGEQDKFYQEAMLAAPAGGFGIGENDLACLWTFCHQYDDVRDMAEGLSPQELFRPLQRAVGAASIHGQYFGGFLGAKIGDNVDRRNSAMSDVAGLLGVGRLICQSRDVTVIADGRPVTGTFMADAEGVDPDHPPKTAHNAYKKDAEEHYRGRGMMDVADLQVLDYICGNVDRHAGNMFYRYDENGDFVGVQGIDNDCAFGNREIPMAGKLPTPQYMRYVTQHMADRVMALEPDVLKCTLQGRGMKDDQIAAALDRLDTMKKAIAEKQVTVLDETQFLQKLHSEGKEFGGRLGNNYFSRVREKLADIRHAAPSREEAAWQAKHKTEGLVRQKGDQLGANTAVASTQLLTELQQQLADLKAVDKWTSSPNFRNMKNALRQTVEIAAAYKDKQLDSVGYVRLTAAMHRLKTMTDTYVNAKKNVELTTDYARSRFAFARGLQTFADRKLKEDIPAKFHSVMEIYEEKKAEELRQAQSGGLSVPQQPNLKK